MRAQVGDEILVANHRVVHRRCEVLGVLDLGGEAPYLVRWVDDGHEVMYLSGPDAILIRARCAKALMP